MTCSKGLHTLEWSKDRETGTLRAVMPVKLFFVYLRKAYNDKFRARAFL